MCKHAKHYTITAPTAGRRWRCGMRIVEGFLRFFNAMYLGVMIERLSHFGPMSIDKVLITLNVITLVIWLLTDIKRMMREVQE